MPEDIRNAAHSDLVEALGDDVALQELTAGWLESADWADAVERVCAQRFPDVPRDEAFRAVGQLLGKRYLASDVGKLVLQSLKLVPRERVFANLVPAMAARLRPGFSWLWEPAPSGGVLRVNGDRVTPASTTQGFFEALVKELGPTAQVQLGKVAPQEFELIISW